MKYISLLILLLSTVFAVAQEQPAISAKELSINIGYHTGFWKDITFSPLQYTTNSLSFGIAYQKVTKNNNQWFIGMDFTPGTIQSDAETFFTADRYFGNLEIGYLHALNQNNKKGKLLIGGQYHTHADLIFYNNLSAISFFLTHGVDVVGKWEYNISENNHFQTQLALPVVALLVRPAYTGWDIEIIDDPDNYFKIATNGTLSSWNDFFSITWKNRFTQQVSEKIGVSFQYHLSIHQSNQIKTAKNLNHQFLIGATINL